MTMPSAKHRRRSKDPKPHSSTPQIISIPTNHTTPLLPTSEPFHTLTSNNAPLLTTTLAKPLPPNNPTLNHLRSISDTLLKTELSLFSAQNTTSDDKWLEGTMKKGTFQDRIAAMSVQISTYPNHKLHILDQLLGWCKSGPSRIGHMGGEALEDLFVNILLPPDRKLIGMEFRPLDQFLKSQSPRTLLLWRVEELVRHKYREFLSFLKQSLSHEKSMEMDKLFALGVCGNLLRERMEGEVELLDMIVNKIGDPMRAVASRASKELTRVLEVHPVMSAVVAREVQQLAHRPHLPHRALYNCILFLNTLRLSSTINSGLPNSLIQTYFHLFETSIASEQKSRLLGALLTGINRAMPFLPQDNLTCLDKYIDKLYKIVFLEGAPVANTRALLILFHVISQKKELQKRYYRALYAKLSTSELLEGKHSAILWFHLIYKSLNNDDDPERKVAMAKRLLATAMHSTPPVICGVIFLLSKIDGLQSSLDANVLTSVPTKRDPTEGGSLWEITLLREHYHPSVVKFADLLCEGVPNEYRGDPLRDFSRMKFLDRFAYRNPKKKVEQKKGGGIVGRRVRSDEEKRAAPVNNESFLFGEVKAEEEFFVRFFKEKKKREEMKGIQKKKIEERDVAMAMAMEDEEGSDTNPEEEAFANEVAESFMESAAGGKGDFDDEDPDMEGWDDLNDDEDVDDEDEDEGEIDYSAMDGFGNDESDDDNESLEDDSSVEEGDGGGGHDDDNDDDAFMDTQDDDSDDDEDAVPNIEKGMIEKDDINDEEDELAAELANESDFDELDKIIDDKKKRRKIKKLSTGFEDASEYEELIAKSLAERDSKKRMENDGEHETKDKKTQNVPNQKKTLDDEGGKKSNEKKRKKHHDFNKRKGPEQNEKTMDKKRDGKSYKSKCKKQHPKKHSK